ncbi:MAG: DUF86 domain-containing protein [Sedimentisphaerales bacterium]
MKYNAVVHRKFALLDKYLLQLQGELKDVDIETFKNDWTLQRMTERVLQVMVEVVIDIAERIIAQKNAGPVATAAEAIEKLVELQVIKTSKPYTDMVRFRNLIIHQYEEINPTIVFNIAKNQLDAFRQFRDEIDQA